MRKNNFTINMVIVVLVILLWEVFILIENHFLKPGVTSIEAFLPSPITVFKTMFSMSSILFSELAYTLSRAMFGLLIGVLFAVFANALFFIKPITRKYFLPISMAINSFPIMGFSPLIILVFGQGSWLGIVFISALISYFPVLISLERALALSSNEFYELGKVWKASRFKIFTYIQLPLVIPFVIGSLKLAIPASIIGATLGEWLGSNHGIGRLIVIALYQLNPGMLYAALLLLLISSILITWLSEYIERKLFPWINK